MFLFSLFLLFIGEGFAIFFELTGAKAVNNVSPIKLILLFVAMTISAGLLLAGYMLGYKHVRNIWVVSAVSISSIVILEPLLTYLIFKTIPVKGSLAGFILGLLGLILSLTWK